MVDAWISYVSLRWSKDGKWEYLNRKCNNHWVGLSCDEIADGKKHKIASLHKSLEYSNVQQKNPWNDIYKWEPLGFIFRG